MIQEKRQEQGTIFDEETIKEMHGEENIREMIRTIESYLIRTREAIERVEKFVQELKQEKTKETDMVMEEDKKKNDPEKPEHALKV